MKRRDVLKLVAAAPAFAQSAKTPQVCVFSKHMAQFAQPDALAKEAKKLGFDGIDLTVRPKGHVLPERVSTDLEPSVKAIRAAGLSVPMITTDLKGPDDPAAKPTLEAMAKLKIPRFKMGYLRYDKKTWSVRDALRDATPRIRGLGELSKEMGVQMGLHNHSGDSFGAAVWDFREVMQPLDQRSVGYYFDPAHATIEGGLAGWRLSLDIASSNLKMVALKDFYWKKENAKWVLTWCPMGEGMVNWPEVFGKFRAVGFTGPYSLHFEYHGGEEPAAMA
ncbi:MAG TPA: sugar phosphate isomerase/epimerase family protein, partial [Bryobacteraceae bacterium]|nr:sugar phosphate isomerase/epimerase family protein [Bryobacteraceae bacterium]